MEAYILFKITHLLGVVIFLGNLMITGWWKTTADRTGDPQIVAFAQRQVTATDYAFTLGGVVLIVIGGYGLAFSGGASLDTGFVVLGQALFYATGVIWLGVLIPVQRRQARLARTFTHGGEIPDRYWRLARIWRVAGTAATVLPVFAFVVMVGKVSF